MTSMRAAVLHSFGNPELLHVEDVETPAPAPDEVQLQVEAAAVKPVDLATRAGLLPDNTPRWPLVLGWDAAGTISAVGRDVTTFAVGQRAVGMSFQPATQVGTYAEQVVLAAADVAALPAGLDTESAATRLRPAADARP